MALVAVSILGTVNLPDEVFRRAGAALAARMDVASIGSVEREVGRAGMAAVLRTRIGPAALKNILNRLRTPDALVTFGILGYGALVYQDESLIVPPLSFDDLTVVLKSLAGLDKDFHIPNLGNVSAHLSGTSDRHPH